MYEDSLVRHFEVRCTDWSNDKIRCQEFAIEKNAFADSVHYRLPSGEYYERSEQVKDESGLLLRHYMSRSGYEYHLKKYDHGKIILVENGCDTTQSLFKEECISASRTQNAKPNEFGGFVFNQKKYVWNNEGRLQERIVWNSKNNSEERYLFHYGSPCDSIRVNPVDLYRLDGVSVKGKYNGSFGKMPEKGDPEYEDFARDPYEFRASPELLARQQKRCEDYKKSLKKK
ncbi:MAG: hypothetical protein MJY85_05895 [Fibrobacter sp.]|nr:hypothetical protein [Fibrobacter sp.]